MAWLFSLVPGDHKQVEGRVGRDDRPRHCETSPREYQNIAAARRISRTNAPVDSRSVDAPSGISKVILAITLAAGDRISQQLPGRKRSGCAFKRGTRRPVSLYRLSVNLSTIGFKEL